MPWPARWRTHTSVGRGGGVRGGKTSMVHAIGEIALGSCCGVPAMIKLGAIIGAIIGSTVGWWLGSLAGGTMTAFMVSTIASGFGIYYGRRIAQQYAP